MKTKGFTLLEMLLYIGIAASVVGILAAFLATTYQVNVKNQAVLEVEQQGRHALDIIAEEIRISKDVTNPLLGSGSSAILHLVSQDPLDETVVFTGTGGVLQITEGASSPVDLHNDEVQIDSLIFTNIARLNTPDFIQVLFTMSYVNETNRNEFNYSQTFTTSVLRRN